MSFRNVDVQDLVDALCPGTHVGSTPAERYRVLSVAPCTLRRVKVLNGTGGDLWLHLFDATALPVDGAVPDRVPIPVKAAEVGGDEWRIGSPFGIGCVAALSSTRDTLTLVSASQGWFDAELGPAYSIAPLDPREVPALMAGGIFLPDESYQDIGGGSHSWGSVATNTGAGYTFYDSHDGFKPVRKTAANGTRYFDLAAGGITASWLIPTTPGLALRWTSKGDYAGWFKLDTLDASIRYLFAQWPGGASGNRILAHKNNDLRRLATYVSYAGSAVGAAGPPDIGGRAKWNSGGGPTEGPEFAWDDWVFVRVSLDMTKENYALSGANLSYRQTVYINEEPVIDNATTGVGVYSAPASDVGGAPPDGPIRGIHSGADSPWFSLGALYVSGQWSKVGPFYIANRDSAQPITAEQWRRVMRYGAPI